jgi:hypothetical protein
MVLVIFAFWGWFSEETADGENETPRESEYFSYEERAQGARRKVVVSYAVGLYEASQGIRYAEDQRSVDLVFDDNKSEFRVGGRIFYGENAGEVNEHRATGG